MVPRRQARRAHVAKGYSYQKKEEPVPEILQKPKAEERSRPEPEPESKSTPGPYVPESADLETIVSRLISGAVPTPGEWATLRAIAEKVLADCRLFIRQCKVEDLDTGIPVFFDLWPEQERVLEMFLEHRLCVVLKARQLGLTWLALGYALWRLLTCPGYRVVALSKREDDAKVLVERVGFMLRNLNPIFALPGKVPYLGTPAYESTTQKVTIHHERGEDSTFLSLPATPDTGRSFTASLIILDEWAFQVYARDIWGSAFPLVNRPTGGQVIGISTARRGTFYEELYKDAEEKGFKKIFLPWTADPRRDIAWYEATKKAIKDEDLLKAEYPLTEEEAWSAGVDTAFPEFSKEIHVIDPFPIPSWWRRWIGNDPGYSDPFAWYWFAADQDGNVYVYREFTRDPADPKLTYSEQAEKVYELSLVGSEAGQVLLDHDTGKPVREEIDFVVTGMDAFNRNPETGKSICDYYREGGIPWGFVEPVHGPNSRIVRKATMHEYLKWQQDENTGKITARLKIFKTCRKLIETLPQLMKDERNPEKVAECSIDHQYDAVSYGLDAHHAQRSKSPPEKKTLVQRHKEKLARMHRYPGAVARRLRA